MDFLVVPTIRFKMLFVWFVVTHGRREVLHFNVTEHPTAQWTLQQFREALPWEHDYRYLVHDRDSIFSASLDESLGGLGLHVLKTPPRSPKANAHCERLIGTVRRECLDQLLILNAAHLQRILNRYFDYYRTTRPHRSLDHDAPESRTVEGPELGQVIELPILGGLHHRYSRQAA